MGIKEIGSRILSIGRADELPRDENKKVLILNFACLIWIPINVLFIVEDGLLREDPLYNIVTFSSTIVLLLGVMFLHHAKQYFFARILFMIISALHFWAFAAFLEPRALLEYFLLLPPAFSLLFFNNKWLSISVGIISYILFTFTVEWFDHYHGTVNFQHTANLALFIAVYLVVAYLKAVNAKSEKSLEEKREQIEKQKNLAIESNRKIEQQHLELAQLHEFQSQFWINLSHEIRTPLTLIKGNVSGLLKEHANDYLVSRYRSIDENSNRIHELLDNIMDLAKMKSHKMDLKLFPTNMIDFCKQVLNSFEPLLTEKKIHYKLTQVKPGVTISSNIDKLFLERALGNLLLNACKYTPEKGNVELIIDHQEEYLLITIKDNGCGISKEELPHVFETFYRSKKAETTAKGTGVGLSFCKEIVELHGGRLTVKSTEEVGSEFTMYLPIHEIYFEETITNILDVAPFDKSKTTTVLLIEDNIDMRHYIKNILSDYSVIEANNGYEALPILEAHDPDIIVTDYMMPMMSGYEFVQKIRGNGCKKPVIVLTARVDDHSKMEFLRLGLDDYLTKPFQEEELIIRVKNCEERVKSIPSKNPILSINKEVQKEEIDKLRAIVESNINSSHFNVTEMATLLSISERTLQRKIKSWCGMTPNEFIREVKLQKGLNLYQSGKVNSLKELTYEVGFTNSSHFVSLFQKRFGGKPDFKVKV